MNNFIFLCIKYFCKNFKKYVDISHSMCYYNMRVTGCELIEYAGVAQLAEQLICNQQVAGSSPITSSRESSRAAKGGRL